MVWAKDRLPGLTPNCAVGTAWPVPDKVTTLSVTAGVVTTVPLLLVACPLMVKVADRAPVVEGVNARLIVQLFEPEGEQKVLRVTVPLGMQLQHGTRLLIDLALGFSSPAK